MTVEGIQKNYLSDFAEIRRYFRDNPGKTLSDKTDDINAHHLLDKYNAYNRIAERNPGTQAHGIGSKKALYSLELLEVFYGNKFKKSDNPEKSDKPVQPFNKKTMTMVDLNRKQSEQPYLKDQSINPFNR